jgi:hypothetical protein
LDNIGAGQAPVSTPAAGRPEVQPPSYASLSSEPAQTSLFEERQEAPASVGKFDFAWESDVFRNQERKARTEDVDFRWNVATGSADRPPAAVITAAADDRENVAVARKREEESEDIFHDDTFHLRTSEGEDAKFVESKKNEEFQELLDEEFERIKERQAEIDEEKNRINESILDPPEPTPTILVTGENARSAAEERIQNYLRKADMEMRKALEEQSAADAEEPGASEPDSIAANEPAGGMPEEAPPVEPVAAGPVVSEPYAAPAEEPPSGFAAAGFMTAAPPVAGEPYTAPAGEPPVAPEPVQEYQPSPAPEAREDFDSYKSYEDSFSTAPDDHDINRMAFGFKHGEGDIAWEREHADYDPSVSAIKEGRALEDIIGEYHKDDAAPENDEPAAEAGPGVAGGIFMTGFANPFAAGSAPSESAAPQTEAGEDGVFNTSFANPFAAPEAPVPPVVPEVPVPPVVPEAPVPPAIPEVPVPPLSAPFVPETPEPLAVPEAPEPLVVPEVPEPLVVPEMPEPLVVPEVPEPLVVPEVPEPLVVPETPEPLVVPEVPEPLVVPEVPEPLVVPETPEPLVVPEAPEPLVSEPLPGTTFESDIPAPPLGGQPLDVPPVPPIREEPDPLADDPIFGAALTPETPESSAGESLFSTPFGSETPAPASEPDAAFPPGADPAPPAFGQESPIRPAPVTAMTSAPISTRTQAPDIINKPVVFPFDEVPEKTEDDIFKVPDGKTPEAYKPVVDIPGAGEAVSPGVATGPAQGAPASAQQAGAAEMPSSAAPGAVPETVPGQTGAVTTAASSAASRKRPRKGVVVLVDILLVIAILLGICFALVKFAPDTGASELITKGYIKLTQIMGFGNEESNAAENDDAVSSADSDYIMPISDGDTLISSQLYNNYNIAEVKYDPGASWEEGVQYTIEGAAAAKPIDDDHWTDGAQGPVLYDESAVAAVITFSSGLVDYINNGNTNFLNAIAVGSSAEKKVAGYATSVSNVSADMLGIGNIRKNGDDLYVWTNETVTETMGGVPVQRTFKRLYLLTPDVEIYKVSDYEDIG